MSKNEIHDKNGLGMGFTSLKTLSYFFPNSKTHQEE